ncbi:hypothetical protein BATDEDRAFT_85504 [Batrachochytrium dendrobatidis JAM81]|uniref:Pseudouridine synthase RsuA/RluA-like domain-containing protein n=2 Tax=Batrachochytrium dendrobatidis TaxID=109871 RepID=F4NU32_BATDJ|nr:uncharacterized protein BATDEDRAFT_85504 [Batrachochytrium dendrobatidis JAM81]EGF83976.1 hypothetical protein BATDEDRAFT_85504 [Batrachochytrium dendrobatidis JAM81]OAJ36332.1 hypothetical protein BDEG_20517 [Batrachochytrium dendrobatidis JEL423]|eukprot:XP_006676297.1 hypothetical protein BATDEDRAFT_85504 [Batrachochytrium dendrobatidis JAM81]
MPTESDAAITLAKLLQSEFTATPNPNPCSPITACDSRYNRLFEVSILYNDGKLLVINKPWNVRIDGPVDETTTIEFLLKATFPTYRRLFLLHQIDYATSGVHMWGLTKHTATIMGRMFLRRQIQKTYLAIVCGTVDQQEFQIQLPLAPRPENDRLMHVPTLGEDVPDTKAAQTFVRVLRRGTLAETQIPVTLLELQPHTGRRHQLRVHLSSIGHPIVNDRVYGALNVPIYHRMMLHSWRTQFVWPGSGVPFNFEAPNKLSSLII